MTLNSEYYSAPAKQRGGAYAALSGPHATYGAMAAEAPANEYEEPRDRSQGAAQHELLGETDM